MTKIAFRVSPGNDLRRLRRCISLAEAMKETDPGCDIVFLSPASGDGAAMLSAAGMKAVGAGGMGGWDGEAALEDAERAGADMIIVDDGRADEDSLALLHERMFTAVFDERAALRRYDADVIINPCMHAHLLPYPQDCGAMMLLGTDFAILPPSFDEYQDQPRDTPERARKILVCFGDDPRGLSLGAVRALKGLPDNFTAMIACGPGFGKGEALASEIGLDPRIMMIRDAEPSRRFHWADISIADPANLPEILFFAIPSILVAAEGSDEASYAARNGMSQSLLGFPLEEKALSQGAAALIADHDARARMSMRMAELVDGLGRYRVAEELLRAWRGKSESL